jgi:hypothetical protein
LGELAKVPSGLKAYTTLGDLLSRTSLDPIEHQVVTFFASAYRGDYEAVARPEENA